MKKLVAILLAALMVCSAGSALAVKVGFSQVGQESDWRTANTDDMKAAIEAEGWELIYDDAQQKQENQVKALRNFISQGVDAILFTGVVTTGWDEVLKEVNEAEIPLILMDRMPDCIDSIDYVGAFGGDFVEEGRRMGYWTGNYIAKVGRGEEEVNVVILEGTTGSAAATDRTAGIEEALANYPNLKVIAKQSGNFSRAEGLPVMESWLKSLDKIDVVLAENDDMALGAIDAIKAAGKVPGKDIIIVGCDSVKAAFDSIVAGDMNATIECNPLYSSAVIPMIKQVLAGDTSSFSRDIIHPDEGCFDTEGGIAYTADGSQVSVKAADVIAERKY
ncbi:MAG: ABC transporter substrate-binding protein [Oscillospiraceae bacterium]|jgi:simple sugar transport system substrate-binding protein|nr:ABC transporter substrate-binding protein [Oscillospiraceae bacterium]